MQFGQKLKELRTTKGISQVELAENIYVSRSAVAKWESGLGLPSAESLKLLAEYFSVSVDELCADQSSESVIVKKNVTISKSRKILIVVSAVSAAIIIALIVCLAVFLPKKDADNEYIPSHAHIVGLRSNIYDGDTCVELWEDYDRTILTDTYLEVGKTYTIDVGVVHRASGGNSKPGFAGGSVEIFQKNLVKFAYDTEIFTIETIDISIAESKFYLTVKKPCRLATVEIQYRSIREYITLSAKYAEGE